MGPGQQIGPLTQHHQVLPQDRLELAGMTKGELPQQRSYGRRCVYPVEQGVHSTTADHVNVVDTVCARAHASHHGGQFRGRVSRPRGDPWFGDANLLSDQPRKPSLLGQRHHRHQPGTGHEAIIVEHRRTHAEPVRHFHRECLSDLDRLMRKEHQSSQLRGHFHRSDTLTNRSTSVEV